MKRFILFLHLLVLLHMPVFVHAEPGEDYEEAYKLYIAATTSVAAYNDRIGELATRYLKQDGWTIDHFVQAEGQSGARFLLANKESSLGKHTYFMAIVGTETTKDIKMDLKLDKVYFAGSSLAEFETNADKNNVPPDEPKVHKGFYEFIRAGAVATLSSDKQTTFSLLDLLQDNPDSKIYLTGHSLGGAAATLTGAWLISMGISPEQIEVITFGAPAVGNAAFAAKFEPTLKLTRVVISGDPVTGVLQALIGGYKQFGQEIKWPKSATVRDPHKLPGYVDFALKN
ncbi:MAG: lipase family protein, partial [Sporomusa sp.]